MWNYVSTLAALGPKLNPPCLLPLVIPLKRMISWTSPLHDQTVTKTFVIAHNDAFLCILDMSDAIHVPKNVFRSCTLIEDQGFY